MNLKKVLVLGGAGFLGRQLVEELHASKVKTVCLENRRAVHIQHHQNEVIRGNVNDFQWEQLNHAHLQVIFHSARTSGRNRKTRLQAARENAKANESLVRWLRTLDHPPLLVYVSGSLVYGSRGNTRVDESQPPDPISFQREYFIAEKPILQALERNEIPVQIVRPGWIYGRGSWLEAFYLQPARKMRFLPIYGKGENLMSFIHVEDCGRKIIHLADQGIPGNIFNVFTRTTTQQAFVKILSELMQVKTRVIPLELLHIRYGKAAREAFSFSLDMHTKHQEVFHNFRSNHPDLKNGLGSVVTGF
jgi:nucleoside-diphosphate-sugar epimerase